MTKVLLVLGTSTGGIGQHVMSLARGLSRRGDQVTVAAPRTVDELFGFSRSGIRFVPVAISDRPSDLLSIRALRPWARTADVVHAHGFRAGLVSALAGAGRHRAPLVVTWHNQVLATGVKGRTLAVIEAAVARHATVTLGASTDLVARAASLGGAARLGAVAAPEVARPVRTRKQVREEFGARARPMLLAVGRLHPQKDYPTMFDAMSRLVDREPVPVLVVAGDGPLESELADRIREQGLPIILAGRRTDVTDLMASADLLLLTSVWEARALVVQEAMQLGLPVVATEVGGIPELAGDAARLVRAGDPESVAQTVSDLLDDPVALAELAAAGHDRSAAWPTEADVVDVVAGVYREVIEAT